MPTYVNPFGAYAEGQVQGGEQERATQDGARRARAQDWQHQYLDPLELQHQQRMGSLEAYRQPFEREAVVDSANLLRDRAADSNLGVGERLNQDTGYTGVVQDAASRYDPAYQRQSAQDIQARLDYNRNLQLRQADALDNYREGGLDARMLTATANKERADKYTPRVAPAVAGPYVPAAQRIFGLPAAAAPAPAGPVAAPAAVPAAAPAPGYDGNDQAAVTPHAAYLQDAYQNIPGFASLHPLQQAAIAHHAVNYNPAAQDSASAKSTQPDAADQYATA